MCYVSYTPIQGCNITHIITDLVTYVNTLTHIDMTYRYSLEKYNGNGSRFNCPSCSKPKTFTRYIDLETNEYVDENIGICNRDNNCGYHKSPKEHFKNNYSPISNSLKPRQTLKTFYHKKEDINHTLNRYSENKFVQFLLSKYDRDLVFKVLDDYLIGTTSKKKQGCTIFWQIDDKYRITTGKIMLYNPDNGKRIKSYNNYTHCGLKKDDEELRQCLFGLHLINKYPNKKIGIVESQKTAIICSLHSKDFLWLSTGGLKFLNENKLLPIKDKEIHLFPDLGCFEDWSTNVNSFKFISNASVDYSLESAANEYEIAQGYDLADYFLMRDNDIMDTPLAHHLPL